MILSPIIVGRFVERRYIIVLYPLHQQLYRAIIMRYARPITLHCQCFGQSPPGNSVIGGTPMAFQRHNPHSLAVGPELEQRFGPGRTRRGRQKQAEIGRRERIG
jgi:hypothetical protein